MNASDVTAVVAHYNTLDLTRRALESLRQFYPDLPVIVVDNGSTDASAHYLRDLASQGRIHLVTNGENLGHGPALHQGMLLAQTPLVLTLDSDCEVKHGGWLELMTAKFGDPRTFAVGEVCWTNDVGINVAPNAGIPYAHPSTSVYRRALYFQLLPFINHGAPCIDTMLDASWHGWAVVGFPIRDFVAHAEMGTRSKFDWRAQYVAPANYRPFFSFVTRCYKRPAQLLRCLESIQQQTDPDYENVIIVDPVGVGVAAANGFFFQHRRRVHGQYIYLIDDDDVVVEPTLVATVKEIAAEHDWPDMIMFRVQHANGILPDARVWGKKPIGGAIGGSAYVVRADVWQRHIIRFGERGIYAGDFDFIQTLFERGYRAFWCDAIIAAAPVQHQGKTE